MKPFKSDILSFKNVVLFRAESVKKHQASSASWVRKREKAPQRDARGVFWTRMRER